MSQQQYEMRKVIGMNNRPSGHSLGIVVPMKYVQQLEITKGQYMKVHFEGDKIWK
jgi:antitoxin component of MazEF toxin-antitoxin module